MWPCQYRKKGWALKSVSVKVPGEGCHLQPISPLVVSFTALEGLLALVNTQGEAVVTGERIPSSFKNHVVCKTFYFKNLICFLLLILECTPNHNASWELKFSPKATVCLFFTDQRLLIGMKWGFFSFLHMALECHQQFRRGKMGSSPTPPFKNGI